MPIQTKTRGVYELSFFCESVTAAFSGREFGRDRYPDFLRELEIPPEDLRTVKQVHGDELIVLTEESRGALQVSTSVSSPDLIGGSMDSRFRRASPAVPQNRAPDRRLTKRRGNDNPLTQADGILTRTPGVALGVLTADCIPAFFWDPERRAIAMVHAGWRGVKAEILWKAVAAMERHYGSHPASIQVALGPAIRRCCYEVGEEFREYFPGFYQALPEHSAKGHVDLIGAASRQLKQAGILPKNIFDTGICTSCRNAEVFSARCGQGSERILSVIQIRKV